MNFYTNHTIVAGNFSKLTQKATSLILLVLLFSVSLSSFAQGQQVSGTVTDDLTGEPLIGANVFVKGTTNGAVTDIEGKYVLSVEPGATIVFSFVGYLTKEIVVGSQTVINVILETNIETLSEIVVVGYGAIEEKDVTGSIAKVGAEQFNKGVITSPDRLLAGKVAGVNITSNGGEPGGGSVIRIRGATSLGASSDPLVVIDGVPVDNGGVAGGRNPLNLVNPADIADITVLKDASAAAIYGARAANGVILITTKTGDPGKLKVTYDAFFSASVFSDRRLDILSADDFRRAVDLKAPGDLGDLGNADTDWVDEVTQIATGLKQMVAVSGGSENHRFYGSANYLDNRGVLKTSKNQNINLSGKYNGNFLDNSLSVNVNTKLGVFRERFAPNVMGSAQAYDPTQPVFDENSIYGGYFEWNDLLTTANPVAVIDLIENRGESSRFLGSMDVEYKLPFIEGLKAKVNVAYDTRTGYNEQLQNPNLRNASQRGGYYGLYTSSKESSLIESYLTYEKNLGNHSFDMMGGYSYQEFISEFDGINFEFLTDELTFGMFDYTEGLYNAETSEVLSGNFAALQGNDVPYDKVTDLLVSFFGRVNYSYKDKYLLTFNLRRDGSSKFSPRNRWAFFPSMAAAWRIMDEPFAEPLKSAFSDLKLRFGWGVIGNQDIGAFQYLGTYRPGQTDAAYQFGNEYVLTLRPDAYNPDIKWEETRSLNIGLDWGILDGRVFGSIDYYDKYTTDLLFQIALPAGSLPFDRAITNIGEMRNNGIELLVNATVIDRNDFTWDISFNAAINRNRIEKLDNSNLPDFAGYETGGIQGDVGQTIQILKVGESINSFRTYRQLYDESGAPIVGTSIEMYEDINDDGIINQDDRVIEYNGNPLVTMGLTSNMSYKKFDASLTFRSSVGNYVYNNVASANGFFQRLNDRTLNNIHDSAFESNFNTRQLFSDYYMENGSFLKLDNISIGYNGMWSKGSYRLYTTAQNVFMITPYSGLDPEIFGGIDNNIYPRSTTILLGVNLTF